MSQYNQSTKNPPWVRSGQNLAQNAGSVAQNLMAGGLPMANAASVLQYPQVFQGQLQQQMYGAMGAVQYPTRAVNSAAFQTNSNVSSGNQNTVNNQNMGNAANASSSNPSNKNQRVFTGTVTKLQGTFGFVNDDIFFQTSCCVKGSIPQVGDRVLVEAIYNANMPFKWNASRLQVLSNVDQGNRFNSSASGYNAVPPPNEGSGGNSRFSSGGGGGSRFSNNDRSGGSNRNNDRNNRNNRNQRNAGPKQDNSEDRKRKRDDDRSDRSLDRERDREKQRASPPKRKSKSPPARRQRQALRRPPPRYTIVVPKSRLGSLEADLMHLTKRYQNLYVPSDFCLSRAKWIESFPIRSPLSLNFPCNFYVMHKDIDSPYPNDAVLEPSDADYVYVAKVMLLSSPGLEELLIKTGISYDPEGSKDGSDDESVSSGTGTVTHISRLIHFLVGTRGKEPMAIGGPWSPSLDGPNPESDPGVLVRTAIRTCKALTGIDLSACTQWFRFLEVHYHRAESIHHGKTVPARVETVVLFVPDVWSASPSRIDWEAITSDYKMALENRLNPRPPTPDKQKDADEKDADATKDEDGMDTPEKSDLPKKDPSHYSLLDPKFMKVSELRDELEARNLSPKGLKPQLVARLSKAIKAEADDEDVEMTKDEEPGTTEETEEKQDQEQRPTTPTSTTSNKKDDEKKKEDDKEKKEKKKEELSEKDKAQLEKRYRLPENPHILVHPHRTHKAGKYDCAVTSLSSLLGYRIEDSKEHSFEVSLFAEAFNEMLMRDFGFVVYKSIVDAPEKVKEEKKDDKDKDKKKEKDGKDKDKSKEDDKEEKDDKEKKEEESVENEEDEKKKEDKRLRIIDNNVLLAYSYFDTTRCGYIYDKDLNDLLYCLGVALSRSQVKKLVQKVSVRDSVHYKKLAEKIKPEDEEAVETNNDDLWEDLITGNRKLLPAAKQPEPVTPKKKGAAGAGNLESGFVMHNGTLVDVAKLLGQLSRSDTTKLETERALVKVKAEFAKLKETHSKSERNIKDLQSDIRNYKDKLNSAYSDLNTAQGNERSYFRIISDIHHKVGPVLKRKEDEEEARRAKKAAEAEVMEIVELTDDDKKEEVKLEGSLIKKEVKEEEGRKETKVADEESGGGDNKTADSKK